MKVNYNTLSSKIHSPTNDFHPKSTYSTEHIPPWVAQLPSSKLYANAKRLYGRLARWSNKEGTCYRSTPQLASEMGVCMRTIERAKKRLKSLGMIETSYEPGKVNRFRFLDHEWRYKTIHKNLTYRSEIIVKSRESDPRHFVGTIKTKEIYINNKYPSQTVLVEKQSAVNKMPFSVAKPRREIPSDELKNAIALKGLIDKILKNEKEAPKFERSGSILCPAVGYVEKFKNQPKKHVKQETSNISQLVTYCHRLIPESGAPPNERNNL